MSCQQLYHHHQLRSQRPHQNPRCLLISSISDSYMCFPSNFQVSCGIFNVFDSLLITTKRGRYQHDDFDFFSWTASTPCNSTLAYIRTFSSFMSSPGMSHIPSSLRASHLCGGLTASDVQHRHHPRWQVQSCLRKSLKLMQTFSSSRIMMIRLLKFRGSCLLTLLTSLSSCQQRRRRPTPKCTHPSIPRQAIKPPEGPCSPSRQLKA